MIQAFPRVAIFQGTVYIIRNIITGKRYIGQTRDKNGLAARMGGHLKAASQEKYKFQIHHALRKYNIESFGIERQWALYDYNLKNLVQRLDQLEIEKIKEFDTFKHGYNSTIGGSTGHIYNSDTRAAISASHIGVKKGPLTAEHREKMSKKLKGKIISVEHRARLSQTKREWWAKQK